MDEQQKQQLKQIYDWMKSVHSSAQKATRAQSRDEKDEGIIPDKNSPFQFRTPEGPIRGIAQPAITPVTAHIDTSALEKNTQQLTASVDSLTSVFNKAVDKFDSLSKSMETLSKNLAQAGGKTATTPTPTPVSPPIAPPRPAPQAQASTGGFFSRMGQAYNQSFGNARQENLAQSHYAAGEYPSTYRGSQQQRYGTGLIGAGQSGAQTGRNIYQGYQNFRSGGIRGMMTGGGGGAAAAEGGGALAAGGAAAAEGGGAMAAAGGMAAAAGPIGAAVAVVAQLTGVVGALKTFAGSLPGPQKAAAYEAQAIPAAVQMTPMMSEYGRRMGFGSDSTPAYRTNREQVIESGLSSEDVMNYGTQMQRGQMRFGTREQIQQQDIGQLQGMAGYSRAYGLDKGQVSEQRNQQFQANIDPTTFANTIALAMARSGASNGSSSQFNDSISRILAQQTSTSVTGAKQNAGDTAGFVANLYSTNDPAKVQGGMAAEATIQGQATHRGTVLNNVLVGQAMAENGGDYGAAVIAASKPSTADIYKGMTRQFGPDLAHQSLTRQVIALQSYGIDNPEAGQAWLQAASNEQRMDPAQQKRLTDLQSQFKNGATPGSQTRLLTEATMNSDTGKQDVYNLLHEQDDSLLKQRGIKSAADVTDAGELLGAYGKKNNGNIDLAKVTQDRGENVANANSDLQSQGEATGVQIADKWADLTRVEAATVHAFSDAVGKFGDIMGAGSGDKILGSPVPKIDLTNNTPVIGGINNIDQKITGFLHAHVPGFATGTSDAPPGLRAVGEQGTEFESDGGGNSIYTHGESVSMSNQYASEETMKQILGVLGEMLTVEKKQDPTNQAFASPGSFAMARANNPYASGFVGPIPNPGTIPGYPTYSASAAQAYGGSSGGGSVTGGGSDVIPSGDSADASVNPDVGNTNALNNVDTGTPVAPSDTSGGATVDANGNANAPTTATAPNQTMPATSTGKWNQFQPLDYKSYLSIVQDGSGGKKSPFANEDTYNSINKAAQQYGVDPRVMLAWTKSENNNATNISQGLINAHNYGGVQFAGQPGATDAGFAEPGHNVDYASFKNDDYFFKALAANLSTGSYRQDYESGNLEGVAHRYAEQPGSRVQDYYNYAKKYPSNASDVTLPNATAPNVAPATTAKTSAPAAGNPQSNTWQGPGGTYVYDPVAGTVTEPNGTVRKVSNTDAGSPQAAAQTTAAQTTTTAQQNGTVTSVPRQASTVSSANNGVVPAAPHQASGTDNLKPQIDSAGQVTGTSLASIAQSYTGNVTRVLTGVGQVAYYCEQFVGDIAQMTGVAHARYQTALQDLTSNANRETLVGKDASNVPAGAVVVEGQTTGGYQGHVGYSIGGGKMVSTQINNTIGVTNIPTGTKDTFWYKESGVDYGTGSGGTNPAAGAGTKGGPTGTGTGTPAPTVAKTVQETLSDRIKTNEAASSAYFQDSRDVTLTQDQRNAAEAAYKKAQAQIAEDTKNRDAISNSYDPATSGKNTEKAPSTAQVPAIDSSGITLESSIGAIDARKAAIQKNITEGKNDKGEAITPNQLGEYGNELDRLNNQRGVFSSLAGIPKSTEPTRYDGTGTSYPTFYAGDPHPPGTGGMGQPTFGPGFNTTNGGPTGNASGANLPTNSGMPLEIFTQYTNEPDPAKKEQILQSWLHPPQAGTVGGTPFTGGKGEPVVLGDTRQGGGTNTVAPPPLFEDAVQGTSPPTPQRSDAEQRMIDINNIGGADGKTIPSPTPAEQRVIEQNTNLPPGPDNFNLTPNPGGNVGDGGARTGWDNKGNFIGWTPTQQEIDHHVGETAYETWARQYKESTGSNPPPGTGPNSTSENASDAIQGIGGAVADRTGAILGGVGRGIGNAWSGFTSDKSSTEDVQHAEAARYKELLKSKGFISSQNSAFASAQSPYNDTMTAPPTNEVGESTSALSTMGKDANTVQSLITSFKNGDVGTADFVDVMKNLPRNIQTAVSQGMKDGIPANGIPVQSPQGSSGVGDVPNSNSSAPQAGVRGWAPNHWNSPVSTRVPAPVSTPVVSAPVVETPTGPNNDVNTYTPSYDTATARRS